MKSKTVITLLPLHALLTASCEWRGIRGNGHITTEQRQVSAFTRIEAGGYFQLEWHPGSPSLSLTTDENLLSHVRTEMDGDLLKIELKDSVAPTRGIKVSISSPSLAGAALRGAVELNASQLSGSTFALETGGATKVDLSGKIDRLLASLTGASRLRAADLTAQNVELSVTGAGKADVNASNLLRAAITGAGKVTYSGHPKSVEKRITGAGKISPKD
jgi:flagellar basal body L-ring protein FlgH